MVKKSLLMLKNIVVWLLGISLALVLISALLVQFWLFPNINQYKNTIAKQLSAGLQQTVTIGHIKAQWQGIQPSVALDSVVILDAENRPALTLNQAQVALSWLSLAALEPRFAEINIYTPNLEIRRNQDGTIWVAGIQVNNDTSDSKAANWLLRQSAIHVIDATVIWTDEMRDAKPLKLDAVNIAITSPPWKKLLKNHHLTISAQPSVGTKQPIRLQANVYGNDISQLHTWRGTFGFVIQNTQLTAFKPWVDYPLNIQRGNGSLVGHVQFANNQIVAFNSDVKAKGLLVELPQPVKAVAENANSAELNLETSTLETSNTENSNLLAIDAISALVDWSGDIDHQNSTANENENTSKLPFNTRDYQVNVKHLNLSLQNTEALREASASIHVRNQALALFETELDYADIAPLSRQLSHFKLPNNLHEHLITAAPSGQLDKLTAQWEQGNSQTPQYQLSTQFKALTLSANSVTHIGFSGMDGKIALNERNGKLSLASQNAGLDFKDILRWPILQNKLSGTVNWRVSEAHAKNAPVINITTQAFNVQNPHLTGKVNATYRIDASKGDYMDISGKFEKAQAKYALFYYPIILGDATLKWLDTSILGGEVNHINLIIKGLVRDFPFTNSRHQTDPALGLFKVTGNLTNGLLEYGTEWPVIEKLNTSLLFEGKRMELITTAGHILGNSIIKSNVSIAQLDADYPILEIVSEAKGPLAEGIKFVNKSPVAEITQGFTKDLVTTGSGYLNLSLKIPLEDIDAAQYVGRYDIKNASMQSTDVPTLTNINGTLNFTEKAFTANNIKAQMFGAPTAFSIATSADKSVRISAKGILNELSINQLLQNASQFITGTSQWVANILIKNQAVNIAIRSDLFGIQSTLPPPLNKLASERLNLRIDQKQLASTEVTRVQFNNVVQAKTTRSLQNKGVNLEQLALHFGEIDTTSGDHLGSNKGLSVTGALNDLDLDAWLAVYQQLNTSLKEANTTDDTKLAIQKLDLNINTLSVFDKKLHQLRVQHKTGANGLQASVQSQELTGDLQWLMKSNNTELASPQANGKLIARLSHLAIPKSADNKNPSELADEKNKESARKKDFNQIKQEYPALDITAANFELGDKKLGALTLNAYPQSDNWVIQKLLLSNPDSELSVEGEWNNWVRNPNTRLNVAWEIKNLGNTLKRFGYADAIKDGAGNLTGQLNWPGSPHDFNTVGLNGHLKFEVRDGQILKVQPGVGRLFGLLSLQSLPRRLTLDFRDLFNSGFAFDTIKANVKIAHGVLSSDNFAMAGPAADVSIKGQASIPDETQLMRVKVNPRISDSVSLAALAGGPLVGAMAFLAQKLLKDPLNKIASTEYNIGGTWDNPIELDDEQNKNTPQKPHGLQ